MEFHVLQDFTAWIKGSGYLTALFLFLAMIPFWRYLTGGDRKPKRRPPLRAGGAGRGKTPDKIQQDVSALHSAESRNSA